LTVFAGGAGLALHGALVHLLGPALPRALPPLALIAGALMMGVGCAMLSELMRLSPGWERRLHRNPTLLRVCFFWALLTPMSFWHAWPVPVGVMGIAALTQGAWLTMAFSLLCASLFVWLHWIGIDLTYQRFQNQRTRLGAQTLLFLGVLGAILLLGAPVLPDLRFL
jgi:hypothetical protein